MHAHQTCQSSSQSTSEILVEHLIVVKAVDAAGFGVDMNVLSVDRVVADWTHVTDVGNYSYVCCTG